MLHEKHDDPMVVLIKGANIADPSVVDQALIDAEHLGLTVDRALVLSGHVSESSLLLVREAHKHVVSREMPLSMALKAMRLAGQERLSFRDALDRLKGIHQATASVSSLANDLTSMMLQAGYITGEQLGDAVLSSNETNLLIGQILLLKRFVTVRSLTSCLNACLLKRDMVLEDGDLIEGLKRARDHDCSLEQALFELGTYRQPVNYSLRLGDLLVMAGMINDSDLLECTELEITKKKTFAQVVKEQGLVTPGHMDTVIQVQSMVSAEAIKPYMAASILRRVVKIGVPLYQALAEVKNLENTGVDGALRIGDLLAEAGLCDRVSVERVLSSQVRSNIKTGRALLQAGMLSEEDLFKSLRLQSLWRYGYLSRLAAVKILKECSAHNERLERTFVRMGVYLPSSMQWSWV
ncbi:MAG: hypothetical protein AB7W16_21825 [Candidatus Obscuribacterales bacterium]